MGIDPEVMGDGIGELIRCVREGQETVFDLVGDVDAEGKSIKRIEISRRKLRAELPMQPPEPALARARARQHEFHDVMAFSDYLVREGGASTLILADVASRTITAILNEGHPTDREEITLKAIEHPLFTPWSKILDTSVPVIDFALFVMQNRRAVIEPDGREVAMIFSQVKMSKTIQMATGVGKKSLNGVMVDVVIAGETKGVAVELPETITINVPLFVGTPTQKIEIDLLVTNRGESVVVYATAANVAEQRIIAFESMVEQIKTSTGQLVGLGKVMHRCWATVPFNS